MHGKNHVVLKSNLTIVKKKRMNEQINFDYKIFFIMCFHKIRSWKATTKSILANDISTAPL